MCFKAIPVWAEAIEPRQMDQPRSHSDIQPVMELTGGLSEIENRALLALGESAGARKTLIHYGKTLSDQEVVALSRGEGE